VSAENPRLLEAPIDSQLPNPNLGKSWMVQAMGSRIQWETSALEHPFAIEHYSRLQGLAMHRVMALILFWIRWLALIYSWRWSEYT
jgi:hypothetical protein